MVEKIHGFKARKDYKPLTEDERRIVDEFHKLYYRLWIDGRQNLDVFWLGSYMIKNPLDMWVYQEIIVETLPEVIVETGTLFGGSALFFATMFEILGIGQVISIDVAGSEVTLEGGVKAGKLRPKHPLITYITGSSVDNEVVRNVKAACEGKRVMAILDSDHSKDHVLKELHAYAGLVTTGCYMIAEDSNVNGHPAAPDHGPGPYEAVEEFLKTSTEFIVDRDRERFLFTCAPNGFLLKVTEYDSATKTMNSVEAALNEGDVAHAIAELESAVRKYPNMSEFKETLDALKKRLEGE